MQQLAAGTWPSDITSALLVGGGTRIIEVVLDGDDVWWAELRPSQNGRTTLMRWRAGETVEVTPSGTNVRTSVHEYGGGAWWAQDGAAYYVEFGDQRLRRLVPGGEPVFLTPEPDHPRGLRYADGRVTPDGRWFVCVREVHSPGRTTCNEVVAVATDGSGLTNVLAHGADFYASPRVSSDGHTMVWVQWMHPNMPWDSTELWIASLDAGSSGDHRRLVGDGDEALQEPHWMSDGSLVVATDRTDWWNLYGVDLVTGSLTPVAVGGYDIVEPHWTFNDSRYVDGLHVVQGPAGDSLSNGMGTPYSSIRSLRGGAGRFAFIGASYSCASEVAMVIEGQLEVVRPPTPHGADAGYFPAPEFVSFPTAGGHTAHGLYYAPANPTTTCLPGERPPLIVSVHGGPTSNALRELSLGHRFWTSRGFALVDVDYRGSSGYGRAYRNLLRGQWCVADVADVEDAVAAAQYLADRGDVDPLRMAIRGGSAGGTTTLLALATSRVFSAGANYFGVTDLAALLDDDHKFESRYCIRLIGPYPEAAATYEERSPINHIDEIVSPLIVLQGADDTVVPPSHSVNIVEAMQAKGLAVEYHEFPGEGHGFRAAEAITRSIEAELAFYGRVFGFRPR